MKCVNINLVINSEKKKQLCTTSRKKGSFSLERFWFSLHNTSTNPLFKQILITTICYCRFLFQEGKTFCLLHWWEYPSMLELLLLEISSVAAFLHSYLQETRRTFHAVRIFFFQEQYATLYKFSNYKRCWKLHLAEV